MEIFIYLAQIVALGRYLQATDYFTSTAVVIRTDQWNMPSACGLVVRVSGYRYRGPGFDPRRYQIFWVVVGLERGPLSLVRSNWGPTWIKK